ncbi:MAG: helix-turn-helix transcriptional regulator [Clostridia bacterium]|nr:helix-turn-helix transcriptional regulator [Clostridia bacterium]
MKTMKEKRNAKKLTQVDVARLVGVSLTAYRQWEEGVMTPNAQNQIKLNEVLEAK